MKTKCFACLEDLFSIYEDLVETVNQFGTLDNGVIFSSTGNYGSTVLDMNDDIVGFHIYICDKCLKEKNELIRKFPRIKKGSRPRKRQV